MISSSSKKVKEKFYLKYHQTQETNSRLLCDRVDLVFSSSFSALTLTLSNVSFTQFKGALLFEEHKELTESIHFATKRNFFALSEYEEAKKALFERELPFYLESLATFHREINRYFSSSLEEKILVHKKDRNRYFFTIEGFSALSFSIFLKENTPSSLYASVSLNEEEKKYFLNSSLSLPRNQRIVEAILAYEKSL